MRGVRIAGALAIAAVSAAPSPVQAEPDYDLIGKQFSLVLQNAHFSRERFSQEQYARFLECYVQTQDPQHLFLSEDEVQQLRERYATSFGDYLLANQTARLAEELYSFYSERALARISFAE